MIEMVAYNFQKQFADDVESGRKTQTIRSSRKNGHANVGDNLQLYTGMRTKQCRKLADAVCTQTLSVVIKSNSATISGGYRITYTGSSLTSFAVEDGFLSWQSMLDWFDKAYGLPFEGTLIKWTVK